MRKFVYSALMMLLSAMFSFGQFPLTPIQWPTPQGGANYEDTGVSKTFGFANDNGIYLSSTYGAQTWSLVDMNGDGKPDLLVTAYVDSTNHNTPTQFNANTNPYWLVYLNTGSGFSTTAIQWPTPQGGSNYLIHGLTETQGFFVSNDENRVGNNGEQSWDLLDMNGDGKPDLVVTGFIDSANHGDATQFGANGSPYWNVYINNGTGFSATATQWPTPVGGNDGEINGSNTTDGFWNVEGGLGTELFGAQDWSLLDINGDGKPDLVVTAYTDSANNRDFTEYSANTSPYWMVYLNTGTGFSVTATQWPTPVGGANYLSGGTMDTFGFYSTAAGYGGAAYGAESWSLHDINGDGKPDLVVTAILDSTHGHESAEFSADNNPYWIVYLNTGSGFSTTGANWPTPVGGEKITSLGTIYDLGFNDFRGDLITLTRGTQMWNTVDMNGDGKPDLVVCGYVDSTGDGGVQFSPNANPYWKVYLNTGTGFASSVTQWITPKAGDDFDTSGVTTNKGLFEYAGVVPSGKAYGAQTWDVVDMNGDGKPDLVVTGYVDSANYSTATEYNATTNPYWNVYINGQKDTTTDTATGIQPIVNVNAGCTLYPNPNHGSFTLQFTTTGERSVAIYDVTGRLITQPVAMQNQQQFNVDNISAGIYFLRITQNGEVKSLKFVVEK